MSLQQNNIFRQLPGLPSYGPLAQSLPDPNVYSEGVVIEFLPDTADNYIINFACGDYQLKTVFLHPDHQHVVILAGGVGYIFDPELKKITNALTAATDFTVLNSPNGEIIALADAVEIKILSRAGMKTTRRISFDGMEKLSISNDAITGEAYDATDFQWKTFHVSLPDASVTGGASYHFKTTGEQ